MWYSLLLFGASLTRAVEVNGVGASSEKIRGKKISREVGRKMLTFYGKWIDKITPIYRDNLPSFIMRNIANSVVFSFQFLDFIWISVN